MRTCALWRQALSCCRSVAALCPAAPRGTNADGRRPAAAGGSAAATRRRAAVSGSARALGGPGGVLLTFFSVSRMLPSKAYSARVPSHPRDPPAPWLKHPLGPRSAASAPEYAKTEGFYCGGRCMRYHRHSRAPHTACAITGTAGPARTARLGPAVWLRLPIGGPRLARGVRQPRPVCARQLQLRADTGEGRRRPDRGPYARTRRLEFAGPNPSQKRLAFHPC